MNQQHMRNNNAPWFPFKIIGDEIDGLVSRDMVWIQSTQGQGKNKVPVFWDPPTNTQPKKFPVVTLEISRAITNGQLIPGGTEYAIGLSGNKFTVVSSALAEVNVQDPEVGGRLWLKYIADSDQANDFGVVAKLYAAKYQLPRPGFKPRGQQSSGPPRTADDQRSRAARTVAPAEDQWAGMDDEPPF